MTEPTQLTEAEIDRFCWSSTNELPPSTKQPAAKLPRRFRPCPPSGPR